MNAPAYNTVAWFQAGTTDTEQAKRFYGDLFGWRYTLDRQRRQVPPDQLPGCLYAQRRIFDTGGEFPNHAIFMAESSTWPPFAPR